MLQAIELTRRAGESTLLDRVSLSVDGGDRIAIIGSTGSGKSLLLRALAMLDPLDGGCLLWRGQDVVAAEIPAYRSRVAYLHQRPALPDGLVEEILRQPFALRVNCRRRFDRAATLARLAALNRGEEFLAKRRVNLSGGESQMTALLRTIQFDPEILLLDEPTAALDGRSANAVESLVAAWQAERPQQRATLWVTHDPEQACRVGASILRMERGQLSAE